MDAAAYAEMLRRAVPGASVDPAPATDMPSVWVDREHLPDVCLTLRDDPALQFQFLADVIGVDHLPSEPRFEVVYHLACLGPSSGGGVTAPAARLRLKVRVPGPDPVVPTVTAVYPTANWLEREVFDLLGISFEGHPDLRRVLMPDDWEGHPLRRDYPVQIKKEAESWQPVQLSAEEFAANVQAARERARQQAGGSE
jgi:NADH-quinone oxidoreductase subunit C